jgi:hypothetical protein
MWVHKDNDKYKLVYLLLEDYSILRSQCIVTWIVQEWDVKTLEGGQENGAPVIFLR